jgi:hypothetical protein
MALEVQDVIIIVIIAYMFSDHDIVSSRSYGWVGHLDEVVAMILLFFLLFYTLGLLALIACLNDPECSKQLEEQQRQQKNK